MLCATDSALYRVAPTGGYTGTWASVPCSGLTGLFNARFSRDGNTLYAAVTSGADTAVVKVSSINALW